MKVIQHIAINCRDLTAQETFYTKHFGFRRCRVFKAGTPNEFLMLRLGSTCLELFDASAEEASEMGGPQSVGFKHLAFEVDDLDAVVKELQDGGVETEEIRDCAQILEGMRICFFNDPDGNRIELVQGYKDESY